MDGIWKRVGVHTDQLNELAQDTLASWMGIRFVAIGHDFLQAEMPVAAATRQPFGLLHGGASAALAETVGSVASWLCIDAEQYFAVGQELNCNHLRGKRSGIVTATARPLHIGRTTHVWDIRIEDERNRLICISRLTMAIRRQEVVS